MNFLSITLLLTTIKIKKNCLETKMIPEVCVVFVKPYKER